MRAMLDRDAELIKNEQFDELMNVYTDDAIMILRGDDSTLYEIQGKKDLKAAHKRVAKYFNHTLKLRHGEIKLFETNDTILVLDQTFVDSEKITEERRATYVFRKESSKWLCAIDNSYGTDLFTK